MPKPARRVTIEAVLIEPGLSCGMIVQWESIMQKPFGKPDAPDVERWRFSIQDESGQYPLYIYTGIEVGQEKASLTKLYKSLWPKCTLSEWCEIDCIEAIGMKIVYMSEEAQRTVDGETHKFSKIISFGPPKKQYTDLQIKENREKIGSTGIFTKQVGENDPFEE